LLLDSPTASAEETRKGKTPFHILLIKPSKYDEDGYVIRWLFGIITSNSLACLYGLTEHAVRQGILGESVRPVIRTLDESFQKVDVRKLVGEIRRAGGKALVCMVGVQTNQYPRALDLALEFRKAGLTCMIGGFHVSGSLAMLASVPPEIQKAIDAGITVVAGEIENEWNELLRAAYEDRLKPVYNFMDRKPNLAGAVVPKMPYEKIYLSYNRQSGFDAGRGCPFRCSFCTIISVQGNKMRYRTADDIEKIVREQYAHGIRHFFITDDNFARHAEWESIADRLIDLKENHGIRLTLKMQTDTNAHKIPRFIEKMARAGVRRVFIGLESVNPKNLKDVGKHHNQLKEYRRMLQAWRDHGVITFAGYIVGFPEDTYESIMRDVEYLKRELPLDIVLFFILTPLPGSADHCRLLKAGTPLDEDLNLYDTFHVCAPHPNMTKEDLTRAYHDAWKSFYEKRHLKTLLLRRKGPRRRILFTTLLWVGINSKLDRIHPFLGGFFRLKGRNLRRPGMPVEPFFRYYAGRVIEVLRYALGMLDLIWTLYRFKREADRPENAGYTDISIAPENPTEQVSPKD
jgi:radical SAM superfamily enzyme YgiQ (UPF0313 family)